MHTLVLPSFAIACPEPKPASDLPDAQDGAPATVDVLATAAAGPAAARGGALRAIAYLAGSLLSILSASLLFRHLGVIDGGRYVLALTLVAIVGAVSDLGLTGVGVRELATRPEPERWSLARDLLGLRIALTSAGGTAVVAIAWLVYSPTLAAGVALACVGLLLQATQDNFALPLVVGLRLGWVAVLEFARQLLSIALTVALVLAGAALVPFLGISIPVGALLAVVTALLVRGTRTLTPSFDWARWRAFMGAMLPYSLAVAASALYFRMAILLVSVLAGKLQQGYFNFSFRMIEVLTLVPGLLLGSVLPIFAHAAHGDHERLGYALGRVFDVAVIAGAWVAVSIAVGAPLAVSIVGGAKFAPAAPVLAVQGIALGAMFVSLVWANALLSLGLYRTILAINLSVLVLVAVLVSALVALDGARGAAIGTALAEIAAIAPQAAAVVRARPALRPSLRVLPRVAVATAFGLAPLALTGLPVIVRLLISTALFAAVVLLSRAAPAELLELVPMAALRRRGHPS